MSDEDWTLLVTEAVKNTPEGCQWPGSEVRWCHVCAEPIWLSQVALRKLDRDHTMRPVCAECGVPMMEAAAKGNGGKLRVDPIDPTAPPVRPLLDHLKQTYGSEVTE